MAFSVLLKFLGIDKFPQQAQKIIQIYFALATITRATYLISSTFYILFVLDAVNFAKLGLLVSIGFVFQAVIDYPTGVISDWLGQKWILAAAYTSHAISFTLLAVVGRIDESDVFRLLVIVYLLEAFALAQESGAMQS